MSTTNWEFDETDAAFSGWPTLRTSDVAWTSTQMYFVFVFVLSAEEKMIQLFRGRVDECELIDTYKLPWSLDDLKLGVCLMACRHDLPATSRLVDELERIYWLLPKRR